MADQQFDYDLFVMGAGSGGVRASRIAASQGVVQESRQWRIGHCPMVGNPSGRRDRT